MRRILYIIVAALLVVTGCDVHEWPDLPETVAFHLKLDFNTNMTQWEHYYDDVQVTEVSTGPDSLRVRPYGTMRYTVKAYPVNENGKVGSVCNDEFVFTKDIALGYNNEMTLELAPGKYRIMVWSDMIQTASKPYLYNVSNFSEITLQGNYTANTDYKDAFRGSANITLVSDIMERVPDTLHVKMERPLGKYEFITNDVMEFVQKEITRAEAKSKADGNITDPDTKVDIKIEDYKVVFYYVGFMPDTYSMITDKPVDSSTGVMFESTLKRLNNNEASLGFDYVISGSNDSAVTVQIAIIDKENTQLCISDPIKIPLRRSFHTIIRGMFLVSQASGGVSINPEYNGDHNLIIK